MRYSFFVSSFVFVVLYFIIDVGVTVSIIVSVSVFSLLGFIFNKIKNGDDDTSSDKKYIEGSSFKKTFSDYEFTHPANTLQTSNRGELLISREEELRIDNIVSTINNKFKISIKSDKSICDSYLLFEVNRGSIKKDCKEIKFEGFSPTKIEKLARTIERIFVGIYAFYDEDFFEHKKSAVTICGGSIRMTSDIECYIDFLIKKLIFISSSAKFTVRITDNNGENNMMLCVKNTQQNYAYSGIGQYEEKFTTSYSYPLIERVENIFNRSFSELSCRLSNNINNVGNYRIGNYFELEENLEKLELENSKEKEINSKLMMDIEKIELIISKMNIYDDDFMEKTVYLKDIINSRVSMYS